MPKLKLLADMHVHTISSGHAYSTIEEYVSRAKWIGLKAIAITDHGPAMPGGAPLYHFSNLRMVPKVHRGIRILKGAEVNITSKNGFLDIPNDVLKTLDVVIASFHPRVGYEPKDERTNTEVLLKVLKNPYVNVIGHPGNPMYPVSVPETVHAAKRAGVVLEINNSSFTGSREGSWERCLEFAREIKKQNWVCVIGSDSHFSTMLGTFDKAKRLVSEAGLAPKNVVNTSYKLIERYIIKRR